MHDDLKAQIWREGWLAGNRWAFTDEDKDSIGTNPYGKVCFICGEPRAEGSEWCDDHTTPEGQ